MIAVDDRRSGARARRRARWRAAGCGLAALALTGFFTTPGQHVRLRSSSLETLERLIAQRPDWALAHYYRGRRLEAAGRLAEAAGAWQTARLLDSDLAPVLLGLGQVLSETRPERAVEVLQQLTRLEPSSAEAWYGLGVCYGRVKRVDQAIEALQRALALREDDPRFHQQLAQLLLNRSQFDEARRHLERALQLDPGNPIAHYALGKLALLANDLERAERELGVALAGNPPIAEPHRLMGEVHFRRRRWEQALDQYQQALAIDPFDENALYKLAQVQRRLGRAQEAGRLQAEFERVSTLRRETRNLEERIENRPDDWQARLQLARLLAQAGQAQTALRHYAFYLAHHPDDADVVEEWKPLLPPTSDERSQEGDDGAPSQADRPLAR